MVELGLAEEVELLCGVSFWASLARRRWRWRRGINPPGLYSSVNGEVGEASSGVRGRDFNVFTR
jgi:hypothetical protein